MTYLKLCTQIKKCNYYLQFLKIFLLYLYSFLNGSVISTAFPDFFITCNTLQFICFTYLSVKLLNMKIIELGSILL